MILYLLVWPGFARVSNERTFDRQKLEEYRQDPAFDYTQQYAASDSLISIMLAYLQNQLAQLFQSPAYRILGPWLFRLLLLGGIVMAVIFILRLKFGAAITKTSKRVSAHGFSYTGANQDDYQHLLHDSLATDNFKLAVRYLFLTTLTLLEQQKKLQIKPWKAPYDYLAELPEHNKQPFNHIIILFENTWYGEFVPNKQAVSLGLDYYYQLKNV